jgi:hypothetical protein
MFCTVILALAMTGQAPAPVRSHASVDTQIFDLIWKSYADGCLSHKDRTALRSLESLHPACYDSHKARVDAMATPGGIAIWREQKRLYKRAQAR